MVRTAVMAGMAERQKEWQNDKMAEVVTYVLFMLHADTIAEWRVEWWNGPLAGMVEWREWREWRVWQNGRKKWQNGSGYIRTIYGTCRHRQRHRQRRHLNLL
jgi:hypothetical protein